MLYVGIFWLWIFGWTRSRSVIWLESGVYSCYEFCYNLNLYFSFSYFFHTLILYLVAYFAGFSRSWYWQPLKNTILVVFLVFCTVLGQYIGCYITSSGQNFDSIFWTTHLTSTDFWKAYLTIWIDFLDSTIWTDFLDITIWTYAMGKFIFIFLYPCICIFEQGNFKWMQ